MRTLKEKDECLPRRREHRNNQRIQGQIQFEFESNRQYVSHKVSSRDESLDLREKNEKNSRRRMGISSR